MKLAIKLSDDFDGETEVTIRLRRTTDRTCKGPGVASRRLVDTKAEPVTAWAEVVPFPSEAVGR